LVYTPERLIDGPSLEVIEELLSFPHILIPEAVDPRKRLSHGHPVCGAARQEPELVQIPDGLAVQRFWINVSLADARSRDLIPCKEVVDPEMTDA
jgi:hypothetical protein